MTEQRDNFLSQIRSLGELVKTETMAIEARARLLLTTPEIYGIRQIILTGSGDSFFAAVAAAPAIRAWTGLPVQPMVSMEASRYIDHGVARESGRNRGILVVALSNSGEGARVVEAATRLRAFGALTLALTANNDSRLGKACERVLNVAVPSGAPAPGTRSYVASLLGAYLLGIRIAEVLMTKTMDEANALRKELTDLSIGLSGLSEKLEPIVERTVGGWAGFHAANFIGSGPSFGTASFAAAKLVEAAGVHATPQDAEEFHHLDFFVDNPASVPAILFAPAKALSRTRAKELVDTLTMIQRPFLVATDDPDFAPADRLLLLPATSELFAPIVQTVPATLVAAFWAHAIGAKHYRGHAGLWAGAQGATIVRNSPIELD
ncbi:SIS domain-containing protein [Kaistia dalseonensis]|uniref:Glutamine--fructose-6-phosphate aminotransferase [isomerizing] n=1 Tax=Kaistia dalseonensis TaxID=410840 RepID=A0ABU0H544_9HYPH|nr:SIS domain-containing protein [Kaistia dalseonensis]MCX5494023.1 SIS domain-containing protein [Kaistia dalseonensis]MDQ0436601.1 glucosamine--fructose-6-phosphate aminotransferase (isomerizing) [Kaistia dalseonensis]